MKNNLLSSLRSRCATRSTSSQYLSKYLWSAKWLRDNEAEAARLHGLTLSELMIRAGTAAFEVAVAQYPASHHWLIVVGGGNNGGDGFVMAKLAVHSGRRVTLLAMPSSGSLPVEATNAKAAWESIGGSAVTYDPSTPLDSLLHSAGSSLKAKMLSQDSATLDRPDGEKVDLIVDALLGTGIAGAPRGHYIQLIHQLNSISAPRLAVDIPSGLNAETGEASGVCIQADHTVSFISLKPGLITGQARHFTGQLHYDTLGLDKWLRNAGQEQARVGYRLSAEDLPLYFATPRSAVSHKGQHGKVLLIGGDSGFGGAIIMAAEACLASGAGLTRVLTRLEHVTPLLTRCPEVMVQGVVEGQLRAQLNLALQWCSVIAVGPGLGASPDFGALIVEEVLAYSRKHPEKPLIIDADGINILSQLKTSDKVFKDHGSLRLSHGIVTPHPGEAARLLQCSVADIEHDRLAAARQVADQVGGVCLLKGPGTVVCENNVPQIALLDAGNAGMAVGGSGDVLTGIVAALVGQKVGEGILNSQSTFQEEDGLESSPGLFTHKFALHSPAFHSVCAGGLVHSVAADLLVETPPYRGERGLRPTEYISMINRCVNCSAKML